MRNIIRIAVVVCIVFLSAIIIRDNHKYQALVEQANTIGINTSNYDSKLIVTKSEIKQLSNEISMTQQKIKAEADRLEAESKNPTSVPILMYHFFTQPGTVGPDRNWLDIKAFESHLQMFKDNGITPITLEQYDMWYQNKGVIPEKSILITIDDGQPGTVDLAAPLLDKYGYTAVSFEITSMWKNYDVKKNTKSLELASHTNDMHRGFCEGITRAGIMQCTEVQAGIDDLITSNQIIEEEATMFCYPFGGTQGNAYAIVQGAGFKYATTIEPGISTKEDDPLLLPRVRVNSDTSAEALKQMLEF